jgi:hypothetical protein
MKTFVSKQGVNSQILVSNTEERIKENTNFEILKMDHNIENSG